MSITYIIKMHYHTNGHLLECTGTKPILNYAIFGVVVTYDTTVLACIGSGVLLPTRREQC